MSLLGVILGAGMAGLIAWFWMHCAQPMLRHRGARPTTTALLFGISAFSVVAEAAFAVASIFGVGTRLLWVIAGGPWLLVVGLPYLDDYRTLARLLERRR